MSRIWHPFTQHALAGPAVKIVRAQGAYLYTDDGRAILDGISSWWVNTHGHCHPSIVQAVQAQAEQLEQVIFAGFTHDAAEQLAEALLKFTFPHLQHVFYSDSGSTAVEVALKMAIGYWAQTGQPRTKIVALEGGYHGDTFGTMSAGGRSVFNALYAPYLFDVVHLPFDDMVHSFERLLQQSGDDIAALVVEPLIQGAGGMRIYPAETLKSLHDMCARYGVLLIADEVMTGFGRTGTKFACAQAGIQPNIMCLSKGLTGGFLPMGATLCTAAIFDAFYSDERSKMFFHSSSYTGNALACAAALASLKIWTEEPVQQRIDMIAGLQKNAAAQFAQRENIAQVRSLGTILALDVVNPQEGYLSSVGPRLYEYFMRHDVLLRPLGNTVYILPPYCITQEELERLHDIIGRALDTLRDDRQQRAA
jgi:adenosylmethionine-8-amino-7-oxononanoate aminotransferase